LKLKTPKNQQNEYCYFFKDLTLKKIVRNFLQFHKAEKYQKCVKLDLNLFSIIYFVNPFMIQSFFFKNIAFSLIFIGS